MKSSLQNSQFDMCYFDSTQEDFLKMKTMAVGIEKIKHFILQKYYFESTEEDLLKIMKTYKIHTLICVIY